MNMELARRIAITIGALLVFILGHHVPLPGVTVPSGLQSMTAFGPVSIFTLSLVPYFSAALIIQLISVVWRRLSSLNHAGETGRRKVARYTLVLTLLLAIFQAFGVASALQNMPGLVAERGDWFLLSATVTMTGGVFFLVWLSEQITRYGIGNGLALIVAVPILTSFP